MSSWGRLRRLVLCLIVRRRFVWRVCLSWVDRLRRLRMIVFIFRLSRIRWFRRLMIILWMRMCVLRLISVLLGWLILMCRLNLRLSRLIVLVFRLS